MAINSITESSCETLINQQIGAKSHESLTGKNYVFCTLGYTWDRIMCAFIAHIHFTTNFHKQLSCTYHVPVAVSAQTWKREVKIVLQAIPVLERCGTRFVKGHGLQDAGQNFLVLTWGNHKF